MNFVHGMTLQINNYVIEKLQILKSTNYYSLCYSASIPDTEKVFEDVFSNCRSQGKIPWPLVLSTAESRTLRPNLE